jgi:N-glycosylase/DNA lyase
MDYIVEKGKITVINPRDFDIRKTLECGQVFRYKKIDDGYEIIAKNQRARLKNVKNNVEIACTDENFFVKYFDLCKNYDIIRLKLGDKGLFRAAIDFGQGIRILQQDPFETLISFIISANNHIPRIKSIIERLSTALGDRCDGFNAFPTAKALSEKDADYYFNAGLGYRALYIVETARAVKDGFDLDGLQTLSTDKARKELMTLKGVGPKVADCILLFGFGREDVFPVDTWIKKVYNSYFGHEDNPAKIRKALTDKFGDLSGYAQQYLFFYKRELEK